MFHGFLSFNEIHPMIYVCIIMMNKPMIYICIIMMNNLTVNQNINHSEENISFVKHVHEWTHSTVHER